MRASVRQSTFPPAMAGPARRRKLVGYYLRHCGNLHYFASIKPYLDHYLDDPEIDSRILVSKLPAGFESEPDYRGYAHLFTEDTAVRDCDLVLTPSFLRPEDRPGVDLRKTRLVQIFHGMSDKPFTYERDFSDYDLCLCVGRRQVDRLLSHDRNRGLNWTLVGYPKFDAAPDPVRPLDSVRRTIVYCPTWRKGGISSIEIFLDSPEAIARITERYDLIVKPHPNLLCPDRPFYEQSIVDRLRAVPGIDLVNAGNVMPSLARADLFIGDISATGYEWLYFGKPMIFLNPQPGVLRRSNDVGAITYLWRCGDVCNDMTDLLPTIERNLEYDPYAPTREDLLNYSVFRPRDRGATTRAIEQIDGLLARPAGEFA